ncbi:MAG: M24 family metallopeptidase [Candidatus Acidiferrales bacterium]
MPDIKAIQAELRAAKMDGWLLYDLYHRDLIAYKVLGLDSVLAKRRWFYMIPAKGEPRKLVHRIEAGVLDSLPGAKMQYAGHEELAKALPKLLGRGKGTIAMQYSTEVPIISLADAGTVETVRGLGKKVVSSGLLVQQFEAAWSNDQYLTHLQAGRIIDRIILQAFAQAATYVRQKKELSEYDLQQWVQEQFRANLLITDSGPIVAVGPHSGDPHYEPKHGACAMIREGDLLLVDMWAKTRAPGSVYYDITWVGYLGEKVPAKYEKVFNIVRDARDAAVKFVQDAVNTGCTIQGWQVDKAARDVIAKAGFAKAFIHRTGHNIGTEVHGNGANMDNLETKDTRPVIPNTCFSVEPGIYLPEFGIRSEVNVYVAHRQARVTGSVQKEIIPLLA